MANEKRLIDAYQFRGKHEVAEVNGKLNSVIRYADIVNAPTVDAVEVVWCKDCKHSACNPVKLTYACRHPFGLRGFVHEGYYFCSYGERREGE